MNRPHQKVIVAATSQACCRWCFLFLKIQPRTKPCLPCFQWRPWILIEPLKPWNLQHPWIQISNPSKTPMTRATPQLSLCSVSHHSQAVHWMEIGLVLLWLFFTYSQGVENAVADVTEWACCLLFCSEIPKKCQATYAWKDAVLALNKINIRKEFWTKRSFNCGLLWRKSNLFEKGSSWKLFWSHC